MTTSSVRQFAAVLLLAFLALFSMSSISLNQFQQIPSRTAGATVVIARPPPIWDVPTLKWEGETNSQQTPQNQNQTLRRPRLLIAQYDAGGDYKTTNSYSEILATTSRVNRAYARHYQHDYMLLRGIFYIGTNVSLPPPSRAAYNKIPLLYYAMDNSNTNKMKKTQYDLLLLLDSDAMLYDFSRDMSTAFFDAAIEDWNGSINSTMLVAQNVGENSPGLSYNVNIGVSLWNLHHPRTKRVVKIWDKKSQRHIQKGKPDLDQAVLHGVLRSEIQERHFYSVRPIEEQFTYRRGTFVKHFIRPAYSSWDEKKDWNADTRLQEIQQVAKDICDKYSSVCQETNFDAPPKT